MDQEFEGTARSYGLAKLPGNLSIKYIEYRNSSYFSFTFGLLAAVALCQFFHLHPSKSTLVLTAKHTWAVSLFLAGGPSMVATLQFHLLKSQMTPIFVIIQKSGLSC
jgi:hypothetical protein